MAGTSVVTLTLLVSSASGCPCAQPRAALPQCVLSQLRHCWAVVRVHADTVVQIMLETESEIPTTQVVGIFAEKVAPLMWQCLRAADTLARAGTELSYFMPFPVPLALSAMRCLERYGVMCGTATPRLTWRGIKYANVKTERRELKAALNMFMDKFRMTRSEIFHFASNPDFDTAWQPPVVPVLAVAAGAIASADTTPRAAAQALSQQEEAAFVSLLSPKLHSRAPSMSIGGAPGMMSPEKPQLRISKPTASSNQDDFNADLSYSSDELTTFYCFTLMVWRLCTTLLEATRVPKDSSEPAPGPADAATDTARSGESTQSATSVSGMATGSTPPRAPVSSDGLGIDVTVSTGNSPIKTRPSVTPTNASSRQHHYGNEVRSAWTHVKDYALTTWNKRFVNFDRTSARIAVRLAISVVVASLVSVIPDARDYCPYSFWAAVSRPLFPSALQTRCLADAIAFVRACEDSARWLSSVTTAWAHRSESVFSGCKALLSAPASHTSLLCSYGCVSHPTDMCLWTLDAHCSHHCHGDPYATGPPSCAWHHPCGMDVCVFVHPHKPRVLNNRRGVVFHRWMHHARRTVRSMIVCLDLCRL